MKNEATSNIKLKELLNKLGIITNMRLRDSKFSKDGINNLHPYFGAHWTLYLNEYCFDTYDCPPSKLLTNYNNNRNGKTVFSRT